MAQAFAREAPPLVSVNPLWPAGMGGYKLRSLPTSSSALTPVISGESPSSRKVGVAHGLNLGKLLVMQTRAVWALRALWFLLPLTVGQAASDAVASAEHAVPFVMTAGLWVVVGGWHGRFDGAAAEHARRHPYPRRRNTAIGRVGPD